MIVDGVAAKSIASCADCIIDGGLVGMPTETVYGLAADACNASAIARVFAAKGRPPEHPLIVHVADAAAVARFAQNVPAFAEALMQAFWPGPLTLILPRRAEVAAVAAAGQNTVGLRSPSHPVARSLLQACALRGVHGLAAPSANQFGRVSPTTAAHVQDEFDSALLILDGGACSVGIESTIVDCSRGAPVLLRPGAITQQQVQAVCGRQVLSNDELSTLAAPAPRASGTLESHYAPTATLRLMDAKALQTALDLLGPEVDRGTATIATYSRVVLTTGSHRVLRKQMPADAAATAQQLFAVLREFDAHGVALIWVETPPPTPAWDAVRDRLQRAAA